MGLRGVVAVVITVAAVLAPVAPASATSQCTAHLKVDKGRRWTPTEMRFGVAASSGGSCSGRVTYTTGDPPTGLFRATPGLDYEPVLDGQYMRCRLASA